MRRVVLGNDPENHKVVAPSIQKDLVNACATSTTKSIMDDIADDFFTLMIDEARDVSVKDEMAIAIRYVNKKGIILERFIGVVHVFDISARSLKASLDSFMTFHGLGLSRCRGQGYDGASNIQGKFNGLKSLILAENKSAYYIHCFAHQSQLALIAVSKKHEKLQSFFDNLSRLCNIVGVSCKRKDMLCVAQHDRIIRQIDCSEIETRQGLNQERALKRAGDTRWGSHFATVTSLIALFPCVVELCEKIYVDSEFNASRTDAEILLGKLQSFEFLFILFFTRHLLEITNDLSQALQRNEQDLVNALTLVSIAKVRLQGMRDSAFDRLLKEVCDFCTMHEIDAPQMEDKYVQIGRSRRRAESFTNYHYFKVELFCAVIDSQLIELNDSFNNVNSQLMRCIPCLDARDSFPAFDKSKLMELCTFHPTEFDRDRDIWVLYNQLDNFILDIRYNPDFGDLKSIGELAQQMVKKGKDLSYPLVYMLVKLELILFVVTTTIERAFSDMKIVKTTLRNRMGDNFLNACMVTFIEREMFDIIEDDAIIEHYQNMKPRRINLCL